MFITTKKQSFVTGETAKINISVPRDWTLGYLIVQANGIAQAQEIWPLITTSWDTNKISEISYDRYGVPETPIPIFNEPGTKVNIEIKLLETVNIDNVTNFTFIYFNKNEIDIKKQRKLSLQKTCNIASTLTLTTVYNYTLYTNNTNKNKFILWIEGQPDNPSALVKIYIGKNKAIELTTGEIKYKLNSKMFISQWLQPNESIILDLPLDGILESAMRGIRVVIADEETDITELPYLTPFDYKNPFKIPVIPTIVPHTKLIPPVPPVPINTNIPPYPIPPNQIINLQQQIPPPVNIKTTTAYNPPGSYGSKLITLANETRIVEGLIGPFGILRKEADTMGRMRTTGSGINYNAGTLNTTDVLAHVVWTGYGTKDIYLHAKTGSFTVQILTLYDWLAGKTIADEDAITIDETEVIEMSIEAREIQITAIAATASEIEWEVMT